MDGRPPHRAPVAVLRAEARARRTRTALWAIPQFHIVCESTLATHDANLMDEAQAQSRLWSIDTGHDLMITEPDFVATALVDIAAR